MHVRRTDCKKKKVEKKRTDTERNERQTDREREVREDIRSKREEWNKTSYDRQTDIYCHKRLRELRGIYFLDMYTK